MAPVMKMQRWAFFKELIPLALILAVLDYYLFDRQMLRLEPSPLWLLIVLIAPRRGSIAGFICGLAATAIYLWLMIEQGYLWQDLLHRQPVLLIKPGLFLLFGTYLGAIGERQTRKMEYFRDKATNLAAQLDSSEIKRTELERDRVEMEKRIAGQGATLLSLYGNSRKLGAAASEEELLFTLETVLREEGWTSRCGIWRISQGVCQLVAGQFNGDIPAIALTVGKNHKVVSSAEWSCHNEGLPGADIAALIMDNESERLVVALADCPFIRLTRNFALRIGMLAEQAGLVLRTLMDREALRRQAALDTESGLVSETYMRRRLNEEIALAHRHKTELSLLACSIAGNNETVQARLETVLSCSIRACIRFSDGLAWFQNARAFVIVLPQCNEQGAKIVLRKIESNLEILDLRDEHEKPIFKINWAIHSYDGVLKGEDIFARLFSALHKEAVA